MCGRYRLSRRKQLLEEHFATDPWEGDWEPRYNIAPTQPVPVIRQDSKEPVRRLSLVRWGLIPSWSKDASGAGRMINARSETAATLPAFRESLRLRRCLVPADGFYEWQRTGTTKQPFCFEVNDGAGHEIYVEDFFFYTDHLQSSPECTSGAGEIAVMNGMTFSSMTGILDYDPYAASQSFSPTKDSDYVTP